MKGVSKTANLRWRERKALKRQSRRRALHARTATEVSPEVRKYDPLRESRAAVALQIAILVLFCLGAVAVHAIVLLGFFGMSSLLDTGHKIEGNRDRIEVAMIEPPKPPDPPPEPIKEPEPEPEEEAPKAPEPEPEPEPEKPKPKPKPKVKKPPPPPDPVDKPKDPPKEPVKPVKRRIGINMESTTEGGDGPSFNTGNTRMGETDKTANDPKDVKKIQPGDNVGERGGTGVDPTPTPNRKATRLPGSKTTKAKYNGGQVAPSYPKSLKRRGIEGNVRVQVTIGKAGKVVAAKVIKSSGYPEFDNAALAAAKRQKWISATKDGQPIETRKAYSIIFRLVDR